VTILDPLLIAALALNFVALGVGHMRAVIHAVALQGILLGIFLFFFHPDVDVLLLVAVTIGLKGFVIPAFLIRALREASSPYELIPPANTMVSLLLGVAGTGLALVFSSTLPLASQHTNWLLVPASLATVWTGFLMLTRRKKAVMQVIGYLILENGIYLFGLLLLEAMPFLVEVGVLLDLFTGVFVMGIIIHHIGREFSSISTEHLETLKE
jgi:hydrogenase-4 component E